MQELLTIYLQLPDAGKLYLADVAMNRQFRELVRQAGLNAQFELNSLDTAVSPARFQVMYAEAQQRLKDIEILLELLLKMNEEIPAMAPTEVPVMYDNQGQILSENPENVG